MKYAKGGYDDKFDEVMSYVELRVKSSGTRLKVRDQEDLRTLFKRLDETRKDKGKTKPRFTDEFIDRAVSSRAARNRYGTVIGKFGTIKTLRREGSDREGTLKKRYQSQGKALYRYSGGFAVKSSYKRGNTTITTFRDAKSGHFVKKNTRFQEVD